jgi:hypothetical protein
VYKTLQEPKSDFKFDSAYRGYLPTKWRGPVKRKVLPKGRRETASAVDVSELIVLSEPAKPIGFSRCTNDSLRSLPDRPP